MRYLICNKCKNYHVLQDNESPLDFSNECPCGGKLKLVENIDIIDSEWKQAPNTICTTCGLSNSPFLVKCLRCNNELYLKNSFSSNKHYLFCETCERYYELQDDETINDFENCSCGGKLKYATKLPEQPPKSNNNIKNDNSISWPAIIVGSFVSYFAMFGFNSTLSYFGLFPSVFIGGFFSALIVGGNKKRDSIHGFYTGLFFAIFLLIASLFSGILDIWSLMLVFAIVIVSCPLLGGLGGRTGYYTWHKDKYE